MNIGPTFMQGPIVVGTDFSQLSWPVVDYATELALEESKSLHLIYAMPVLPDDSPALLQIQKQELKNQVNAAEKKLRRSGLKIESTLVMGAAAAYSGRCGQAIPFDVGT